MTQITLLTGRERRRRWTVDERRQILVAAFKPGAVVADVSRQFEVATSMIYKWRRELGSSAGPEAAFAQAVVVSEHTPVPQSPPSSSESQLIVLEFANGARLTIGPQASATLAATILRALR